MASELNLTHAPRVAQVPYHWTADDVIRYHLALGAGSPDCSGTELGYVYEAALRTLGTFAAVPASAASALIVGRLGVDTSTLIHGEQAVELFGPLPVDARSHNSAQVSGVRAAGTAVRIDVVVETVSDGTLLARSTFGLLAPGADSGGGAPGAHAASNPPGRAAPDAVLTVATLPQQAALYRMSGDRTPVHIDPEAALAAGFPRPTLPGLCTWGMAAKSIVDRELHGDPTALTGFRARFSGPVYPGETLEVSMWRQSGGVAFTARVVERDATALSRGSATFG